MGYLSKINMEKEFKIKSESTDEIYTVVFKIDNDLLSITCDCKAGAFHVLCKHRLNLVDGDVSAMVDKSDVPALQDILTDVYKSKVSDLFGELNAIESEIKELDIVKKKLRKEIGLKFSTGF